MMAAQVQELNTLVGFDDIKKSIEGWEDFLRDGTGFLGTAQGAYGKSVKAFTTEILYNVIAMAIEKFVMAALMYRGAMPYNHTMGDLVEAMEGVFCAEIVELKGGLLKMDTFQEICDVDHYKIIPPERGDITWMLVLAEKMKDLAYKTTGEVMV